MEGTDSLSRVSSAIEPSLLSGTLKSTRMRTFLSRSCKSCNFSLEICKGIAGLSKVSSFVSLLEFRFQREHQVLIKILIDGPAQIFHGDLRKGAPLVFSKWHRFELNGTFQSIDKLFCRFKIARQILEHLDID